MAKMVVIEESECTACGTCVEICPEVFALEDGAEAAIVIQPTGGPEDSIQEAIDSCPTSCIQWQDQYPEGFFNILAFNPGLVLAVFLSILITGQIAGDGESNWLKGVQLLAVYVILEVVFFFSS